MPLPRTPGQDCPGRFSSCFVLSSESFPLHRRKPASSKCWSWDNKSFWKNLPMNFRRKPLPFVVVALVATATLVLLPSCTKNSTVQTSAPVDLHLDIKTPFRFVAYGDTRFHDPKDTEAASPPVRVALVNAIAEAN